MLTQMTANKGIRNFGERAVAAILKECGQLNKLSVFGSLDPDSLSHEEKRKALRAIILIKQKRCGKIKARTCADGRPQRSYVPRDEAASPTVSMEALLTTLAIDAKEKRDVAVFDVPSAYLHAEMPASKKVLIKLEDKFVDIMCQVNPRYLPYVRTENGKKVLSSVSSRLSMDALDQPSYGITPTRLCYRRWISSSTESTRVSLTRLSTASNAPLHGMSMTIKFHMEIRRS